MPLDGGSKKSFSSGGHAKLTETLEKVDLECHPPPSYEAGDNKTYEAAAPFKVTAVKAGSKREDTDEEDSYEEFKTSNELDDDVFIAEGLSGPSSPAMTYATAIRRRSKTPDDDYDFQEPKGKGAYGEVSLVKDKRDNKLYALKKMFNVKQKNQKTYAQREIVLMRKLSHKNICKLVDAYRYNEHDVHMVLEACEKDLFQYNKKYLKNLTGQDKLGEIKHIGLSILSGLMYMHGKSVLHRDLKPGNILLKSGGGIKICDFGLSRRIDTESPPEGRQRKYSKAIGSIKTKAPEMLMCYEDYGCEVDMWSVACIIGFMFQGSYAMVGGASPVGQVNAIVQLCGDLDKTFVRIWPTVKKNNVRHVRDHFEKFVQKDKDALDLIDLGFTLPRNSRPTAAFLKDHHFFHNDSPTPIYPLRDYRIERPMDDCAL